MSTYLTKAEYKELTEVPDPYFGGAEGFEKVTQWHGHSNSCAVKHMYHTLHMSQTMDVMNLCSVASDHFNQCPYHTCQLLNLQVLDLLEDACEGLLSHINSRKFATES